MTVTIAICIATIALGAYIVVEPNTPSAPADVRMGEALIEGVGRLLIIAGLVVLVVVLLVAAIVR